MAVRAHELAHQATLFGGLTHPLRDRPQPQVQRAEAEHEAESGQAVFDPVAAEPAQVEHDDERRSRRERERRDDERPHEERVARNVEALPKPEERREHEQAQRRLLEVETLYEMRKAQADDQHDRELPGTPPPAREGT